MNFSLKKILVLAVVIELFILLAAYLINPLPEYTFRYAARYSGRFSLLVFLGAFYVYAKNYPTSFVKRTGLQNMLSLFAVIHIIHFVFLALSVYLNKIPLEFVKVIGGFLAYAMLVIAPFKLAKVPLKITPVYFYYVSLVMGLTYVARIKGDFEGAEPFWFHYVALSVIAVSLMVFTVLIRKKKKVIDE